MNAVKKLLIVLMFAAITISFLWLSSRAQVGGGTGPDTQSLPQVTATQCPAAASTPPATTKLVAQSLVGTGGLKTISDRMCYTVTNYSTTIPVQVGEFIGASQGWTINAVPASLPTGSAGGSVTVCTTSEVDACGIGGSAVVGTEILRRQ